MPKRLFQAFFMIIYFIAFMPSVLTSAENESEKTYSFLVLGDSISTGYGLPGYSDDKANITSYANGLAEKFSSPERYINKAVDGMTSSGLLETIRSGNLDNDILNSEIIVVTIGGNDVLGMLRSTIMQAVGLEINEPLSALKNVDFTDENTMKQIGFFFLSGEYRAVYDKTINNFAGNFTEISDYIYTLNPDAIVIYQTLYNPMSGVTDLAAVDVLCESCVDGINVVIGENIWTDSSQTAQKYFIADVHTSFTSLGSELTRINSFDIHPNEKGHQTIFDICKGVLNNIISDKKAEEILKQAALTQQVIQTVSPEPDTAQLPASVSKADNKAQEIVAVSDSYKSSPIISYAVLFASIIALAALILIKIKSKK